MQPGDDVTRNTAATVAATAQYELAGTDSRPYRTKKGTLGTAPSAARLRVPVRDMLLSMMSAKPAGVLSPLFAVVPQREGYGEPSTDGGPGCVMTARALGKLTSAMPRDKCDVQDEESTED